MIAQEEVIGVSLPRIEGQRKVTGSAGYAADIPLEGLLWGKVLRSSRAHARIVSVDVSRARVLPGVHAVLTGQDLNGLRAGSGMRDVPVLCADRVRFVGDPVAAVAAEDPDLADQALDLIHVEYEDLPAVFDPLEALGPNAPVLHPDRVSYTGGPDEPPEHPNQQSVYRFNKGDVDAGFAEADQVFDHTFHIARTHQGYLEPRATSLRIEPGGTVRLWTSCKMPYKLRRQLADLFELDREKVIIEPASIGGDFGAKGDVGPEPLAYVLAKATGRPIKVVRTYVEEMTAGNPRHPAVIRVRTGVKKDGTIVAREMQITLDGGAYAGYKYNAALILPSVNRGLGPYNIPNTRLEARWAYTNNVPGGIARAPGQPQVVFAGESDMEMVAREMGLDPVDFRLKNMIHDGDVWPHGAKARFVAAQETLELARKASGWDAPLPAGRGRGVAISERGIGSGASGLVVTFREDGRVHAVSGMPDIGTGAYTVMWQTLADRLHVPLDAIDLVNGNTAEALPDSGTGGSKGTYSAVFSVRSATEPLAAKLRDLAAEKLECAPVDIEARGTVHHVKGVPTRGIPTTDLVAELAKREGGECSADTPGAQHDDRAPHMCSVVCVAEVEVDPETGEITPVKITMANDVGARINPRLLEGQVEGAMMQGLGMALMEDMSDEDGRVPAHLGDYKMPVMPDFPEFVNVFLEGVAAPEPYGAKAVGELGCIPVGAAVANAVEAASGVRVTSLPVTSEKVRSSLS
jgi:CO/xanthine dehydrogenase Mo-binding subunit